LQKPDNSNQEVNKVFWEDEGRKPLPMRRKRTVYKRAKGCCEKCGRKLSISEGDFHHTRDPKVIPRAENIRFLCPLCHRRYGHKRKTISRETLLGTEKEVRIVRKDVVKIEKPVKRKPKTKRVAIRGVFGDVIGYRTVKIRSTKPKRKIAKKKSDSAKSAQSTKKKTK
jgi:hypothetical protein